MHTNTQLQVDLYSSTQKNPFNDLPSIRKCNMGTKGKSKTFWNFIYLTRIWGNRQEVMIFNHNYASKLKHCFRCYVQQKKKWGGG
jgi:hypothetical protein